MKTLGVITARGGSKGIPGKNLRAIAGRPLIAYTIDAARQSRAVDRLILSTDAPAIADAARSLGCDVPFMRPAELARDETPHLPVMKHAVEWMIEHQRYEPDLVMILQPTSPLRTAADIRAAVELIESSGADSVVSVSAAPVHYNPMRMLRVDDQGGATLFVTGEPVRRRHVRRQDLPAAWFINEAIYLFRTSVLFDPEPSLYGDRTSAYVMPFERSIAIDGYSDEAAVEQALTQRAKVTT